MAKIYFDEEIYHSLDNQANGRINRCLSDIEALDLPENKQRVIRKFVLDTFNSYHRLVKKEIDKLINGKKN